MRRLPRGGRFFDILRRALSKNVIDDTIIAMFIFRESGELSADEKDEVRRLNPLKLAFVGDAVFELYVRTHLTMSCDINTHKLAVRASHFVRATTQARAVLELKPRLSDEEWEIVLRGRNQNPKTVPKNASVGEYRYATGFEALIGYLYLVGEIDRLKEIVEIFVGNEEEFYEQNAK